MLDASEEWRQVQEQEVLNVGHLSTHFATRIITDAQACLFLRPATSHYNICSQTLHIQGGIAGPKVSLATGSLTAHSAPWVCLQCAGTVFSAFQCSTLVRQLMQDVDTVMGVNPKPKTVKLMQDVDMVGEAWPYASNIMRIIQLVSEDEAASSTVHDPPHDDTMGVSDSPEVIA